VGFFPGFGGFLAGRAIRPGAAEFAEPAAPACSFVLWERLASPKKSMKSRLSHLARALRLVIRTSFQSGYLRASISDIPDGSLCKHSSFAGQGQRCASE
jgi:hypothetical protein